MAPGIAVSMKPMEPAEDQFSRPALELAPNLLGARMVSTLHGQRVEGTIVETEAYHEDDPASHSYNGVTPRCRPMFGPPGHWYIYRCYGIHWMANVVCGKPGNGQAVLLRAIRPEHGIDVMESRRGQTDSQLTNGPGKLAEALGITDDINGDPISPDTGIYLLSPVETQTIYQSPRVGIEQGTKRPWRFFWDTRYRSQVKENDAARRRD